MHARRDAHKRTHAQAKNVHMHTNKTYTCTRKKCIPVRQGGGPSRPEVKLSAYARANFRASVCISIYVYVSTCAKRSYVTALALELVQGPRERISEHQCVLCMYIHVFWNVHKTVLLR